ncbi:MAG: hypothetical protein Q7T57_00305 [Dehalococcoidales bacterium]|nr:hypothetical protein [Dehalococcoidales bacterium]
MVVFSSVFVSQLRLLENLRAELQCLDSPLSSANQEVGHISVHQLAAKVMTLYSNFYSAVDSTRTYRISTLSESLAVQRVAAGELSLALLNPAVLSSNDISILGTASAVLTPAFMVGVVPIFTLPAALTTWAFASVNKATVLTMPALYPLKLDLETAAAIFIGQVTSWLDPRLVLLNPQLPDWFTASSASPALTLIVGATAVSDSRSSAKLLFQTLAASQLAQKPENAGFFNTDLWTVAGSNPFSAVLAAAPNTTVMIDVEPRTSIKVQTTPGSVSYRPVSQSGVIRAITDVATVVEFVFVRGPSDTNPVRANVASLKACSAPYTDYVAATTTTESVDGSVGADAEAVKETLTRMSLFATQQRWVDSANPADGCWPLATLLSFASSPEYSTSSSSSSSSSVNTDQCLVGMHALEFINYIQTTNILNGPAESFGVTRLAEAPTVKRLSQEQVYAATCNGEFMLVIQPSFYTVSDSVVAFGRAIGIIGLLVVLVSTVIVIQFRFRVIIRSASVPFLLVILAGIALLFGALIAWSVEPTKRSCDAFAWLVNLGLACIFVPLFAKTWRVWRVRQHLTIALDQRPSPSAFR